MELACLQSFTFGKFYAITNSTAYVNQSKKGVGTVFCTHCGATTKPGSTFDCPEVKWLKHGPITLSNGYVFDWEQIGGWYFLELHVPKPSSTVAPVAVAVKGA